MKHLKKLFIVALCAQAYTANAAINWEPLSNMLNTLEANVGLVVSRINQVNEENTRLNSAAQKLQTENNELKVAAQGLENEKNKIMEDASNQIRMAQSGSEEDVSSLNKIVDGVTILNNQLLNAVGNLQQQNQNFQNQGMLKKEENRDPNQNNQGVNALKVGSDQDKQALNNIYSSIASSKGAVSNDSKQALIKAFSKFYPDEPQLVWSDKNETLNKVFDTAVKYGFAQYDVPK